MNNTKSFKAHFGGPGFSGGPASPFDKVLSCKIMGNLEFLDILGLQVPTWVVGHSAPGSWSSHRSMKAPARADHAGVRIWQLQNHMVSASGLITHFKEASKITDSPQRSAISSSSFPFFSEKNTPSPQPQAPHCVGSAASPRCSVQRSRPRTPCAGSGVPSPLLGWWPRVFWNCWTAVWNRWGSHRMVMFWDILWGKSMSNNRCLCV